MPAATQLRVVLDTNVYLSGLLFGGKPAALVSKGLLGEFVIVSSLPILAELREKLEIRFNWKARDVKVIFRSIIPAMEIVKVAGTLRAIPADPDDNPILETAIVGSASYIVSGDKHILSLEKYGNIQTITVDKFLTILPSARHNFKYVAMNGYKSFLDLSDIVCKSAFWLWLVAVRPGVIYYALYGN